MLSIVEYIVMRILSKRQLKELVLYSPQHIARLEKAGSTPLTRTLQKSPIMGEKECSYVEEKKVQPRVQARRC